MEITLKSITVGEIFENYTDNDEEGVFGYRGLLNIRPKYQREFIYNEQKRNAVIDTLMKGFPLNVMYWGCNADGSYEVIDGQQRTISICQYLNGDFSFQNRYFFNLTEDEKHEIKSYKLMIYQCKGTDAEKLKWFETINIAGEELTKQELRNAIYSGSWLTDAKRKFSKRGCPAENLAGKYLSDKRIRQGYLERAIDWVSHGNIEEYMALHQNDENADELWEYFKNVIDWVKGIFPNYRPLMKGLDWGGLYERCKDNHYDPDELEEKIQELCIDDEIENKKGIFSYVLTGEERTLNLRTFTDNQKAIIYSKQGGLCPRCKQFNKPTKDKVWKLGEMEADHIRPWHEGGKTTLENCQMLCRQCNREKGGH